MQYDDFIGQVQSLARLPSMGDAVRATRATFETLAERIPIDEVKDLASQLPSEIAYYLKQTAGFLDKFGLDEFFQRVSRREQADLPDAIFHARVVMSVLQSAVTKGELDQIRSQLPEEFAPLFVSGPQGPLKKAA
jgi:uncharacterized protein (DUF2267 family)